LNGVISAVNEPLNMGSPEMSSGRAGVLRCMGAGLRRKAETGYLTKTCAIRRVLVASDVIAG
jgi:hypothetical protein